MNINTQEIINILSKLSKTNLSESVKDFIRENTETYGKIRLVLEKGRYSIRCDNREILGKLNKIPEIYDAFTSILNKNRSKKLNQGNNIKYFKPSATNDFKSLIENIMVKDEKEPITEDETQTSGDNWFEIDPEYIEKVKETCIRYKFPLLEEYDFEHDETSPNINMMLKPRFPIRYYQKKALSIMFNSKRARSGIIVLPCGAGKTLVGIMATGMIKKNTIVLCNSNVSVDQWYKEYREWTTIDKNNVIRYTSRYKDNLYEMEKTGGVLITAYSMMGFKGNRSEKVTKELERIKNLDWGLMILDEVQVVPAEMFRKILSMIKSHCKLGLTATLLREDRKIEDLNFLIGPKHYEANWLDLQNEGYLARVRCLEIWCDMDPKFYEEYLRAENNKSDFKKKMRLYVSNPNKFLVCKTLMKHHEANGDKIIIFSDNLFCLEQYAKRLKIPFISGNVGQDERTRFLDYFKNTNKINTLMMSKVGDTSLDLPNANVIIQISSHFGSRRQEAQRLGRILRPKKDLISEYNACFYTIISKNTEEMYFSNKRHKYLVDQGYSFKVISKLEDIGIKTLDSEEVKNELTDYHDTLLKEIRDYKKQDDESISDQDAINEFGDGGLEDGNTIDDNMNDIEEELSDDYMDIN